MMQPRRAHQASSPKDSDDRSDERAFPPTGLVTYAHPSSTRPPVYQTDPTQVGRSPIPSLVLADPMCEISVNLEGGGMYMAPSDARALDYPIQSSTGAAMFTHREHQGLGLGSIDYSPADNLNIACFESEDKKPRIAGQLGGAQSTTASMILPENTNSAGPGSCILNRQSAYLVSSWYSPGSTTPSHAEEVIVAAHESPPGSTYASPGSYLADSVNTERASRIAGSVDRRNMTKEFVRSTRAGRAARANERASVMLVVEQHCDRPRVQRPPLYPVTAELSDEDEHGSDLH